MNLSDFEDTDALCIELRQADVFGTRDVDENTLIDVVAAGRLIGITIKYAKNRTELAELVMSASRRDGRRGRRHCTASVMASGHILCHGPRVGGDAIEIHGSSAVVTAAPTDAENAMHECGMRLRAWDELRRDGAILVPDSHRDFAALSVEDLGTNLVKFGAFNDEEASFDLATLALAGYRTRQL